MAEVKPYYQDNHIQIFDKDCRSMDEIPDNSIQCVVTSPPYWGLRKYSGVPDLIWGDNHCEHRWGKRIFKQHSGRGDCQKSGKYSTQEPVSDMVLSDNTCQLCGAWKGSYGLEPTPEMYIQHTIEILREIRRVLRKDGVVFWNIGDSYAGSWGDSGHRPERDGVDGYQRKKTTEWFKREGQSQERPASSRKHHIIKPKDLCLIPFRVAIAAQEAGWWVRSVIIWSKPNPMPESVTDRPTESHEYILLLTKSAKYYWDADAVREPHHYPPHSPGNRSGFESRVDGQRGEWGEFKEPDRIWGAEGGRNIRSVWEFPEEVIGDAEVIEPKRYHYEGDEATTGGIPFFRGTPNYQDPRGRNLRSVWNFPTQPYPEAHFAVFPEKLPEICIKAATPEVGCCSKCGTPWERVIEKTGHINKRESAHVPNNTPTKTDSTGWAPVAMATDNWQPTCKCNPLWKELKSYNELTPALVLDSFAGAGTTLWVAKRLNRKAIGYELSQAYCELIIERCRQQVLL